MRLFKKHCESECPNFSHKNIGAISLEYILVIVVVALVALTGMRFFGSKVGTTINDSANAVQTSTSNVFNQLNGGSGSGGGSTPAPTVYEYYKSTDGDFIITKSSYESIPEAAKANYVGWEGDVYQHTASHTNSAGTYNGTELTTQADTMLYGYDVYNGSTLVGGCVYSTYLENGAAFPPNPSRTVNNRTELSVTHTKLQ